MTMNYYFNAVIKGDFDDIVEKTTQYLQQEGFGVLTSIDIKQTLKKKLDVDFKKYTILGACNPHFAHKALQMENKVGTMLPCNVIVQEIEPNIIEVSAVDPIASMQAIKNPKLESIASEVSEKLKRVIENLNNEK